jgi:hypothetical protein
MFKKIRIIVAGSRNFRDYHLLKKELFKIYNKCLENNIKLEIVSGGAKGADYYGELFAEKQNVPVKLFKANWDKYDKAAGIIRNKEMAHYADVLIAFWDGISNGTKDMINQMKKFDKPTKVIKYD